MKIGKRQPRKNEAKPEIPTNLISEGPFSWSRAASTTSQAHQEFREALPRGPLVDHLMLLRKVFTTFASEGTAPDALAIFDHSLREIAVFTAEQPDYPHKRGNW